MHDLEMYLYTNYKDVFTYVAKAKNEFVTQLKEKEKIRTFYAACAPANLLLMICMQPFCT